MSNATASSTGVLGAVAFVLVLLGMARPPLIGDRLWRFLCWVAAGEIGLFAWSPRPLIWVPLALGVPVLLALAFVLEAHREPLREGLSSLMTLKRSEDVSVRDVSARDPQVKLLEAEDSVGVYIRGVDIEGPPPPHVPKAERRIGDDELRQLCAELVEELRTLIKKARAADPTNGPDWPQYVPHSTEDEARQRHERRIALMDQYADAMNKEVAELAGRLLIVYEELEARDRIELRWRGWFERPDIWKLPHLLTLVETGCRGL